MKNIETTVTASDNTINLVDLARVTGGAANAAGSTSCIGGGCIPDPMRPKFPFPSPFPGPRNPFPGPRNPFPGPRNPIGDILGGERVGR